MLALEKKQKDYELNISKLKLKCNETNKKYEVEKTKNLELESCYKKYEDKMKELLEKKEKFNEKKINISNDYNKKNFALKNELEKNMQMKIDNIKNEYKKTMEEEIIKIKKAVMKTIGDQMKSLKDKYNQIYLKQENEYNKKFSKISQLILDSNASIKKLNNINNLSKSYDKLL